MSKDIKNDTTPGPEDQARDFPRGSPAHVGPDAEAMENKEASVGAPRLPSEGEAFNEQRLRFPPASQPQPGDKGKRP